MGIKTEYQCIITCDRCGDMWVNAYVPQKEAIEDVRSEGWSIGKKVTCAECKKETTQ